MKELLTESNQDVLKSIVTAIREMVPYTMSYQMEKKRPAFQQLFQEEWLKVEELLIVAMLYHSNSVEEAKKFAQKHKQENQALQVPGQSKATQFEHIQESLKLIGT